MGRFFVGSDRALFVLTLYWNQRQGLSKHKADDWMKKE